MLEYFNLSTNVCMHVRLYVLYVLYVPYVCVYIDTYHFPNARNSPGAAYPKSNTVHTTAVHLGARNLYAATTQSYGSSRSISNGVSRSGSGGRGRLRAFASSGR